MNFYYNFVHTLFQFVLRHIYIQNYDSNICGKVFRYNYSLKTYRIFAIIRFFKFDVYQFDAYCLL